MIKYKNLAKQPLLTESSFAYSAPAAGAATSTRNMDNDKKIHVGWNKYSSSMKINV